MNANWSNLYFLNIVALLSNKSSSQEWKAFHLAISHVNSNKSLLPSTTVKAFEGDMDEENILEYGECLTCGLNNSLSVTNLLPDTCTIMNMNHGMHVSITGAYLGGGGGVLGCSWPSPPLGRPSFEQTTYNIQVAKTPWQYLVRKSHCWKAHFFKICFFVKYFRQGLLSLVSMGLHTFTPH